MLTSIQVEVLLQMGQSAQGLVMLDEVLATLDPTTGSALAPDILRLRGEVLLALGPARAAEAEATLLQALKIARSAKARMVELRVALSLDRMWRARGQADTGRQLVSEVYGRFTEGFTTADLLEAKELISG